MRDVLRGIAIGIVFLAIAGALASRLGVLAISVPRASTTAPWLLSRVSGVTAFIALALDVILGLFLSTHLANRVLAKGAGIELHRWLSPLALALVLGHAVLLLGDDYVHFDAIDLLVPFASPYRPVAVGIGVVAAYLALAVHASFALRKRLGAAMWRRLHYLSFVALVGAGVHAVVAGTDSGILRPFYSVPLAIVGVLAAYRISARHGKRSRAARD